MGSLGGVARSQGNGPSRRDPMDDRIQAAGRRGEAGQRELVGPGFCRQRALEGWDVLIRSRV